MIIGVPKEIKNNESRVAITPSGVQTLVQNKHQVFIEHQAGIGSGFSNQAYEQAGAIILQTASEVWAQSELIIKVKEPLPSEYIHFREGLMLFTYLHLAAEPQLAQALIDHKVTALAYETIEKNGQLPLLYPMSEVAGRMSVQIGAQYLEKINGGLGILLGGVPGVSRGKVTVIGGGSVGINAAKIAIGLGADVTIIDISLERLRELDDIFGNSVKTLISNAYNIENAVIQSDLVIGAVLIPGAKAPKLVTEQMVKQMKAGSVIVDVAVDQGGIIETADLVTTHANPTYVKHDVVHYAVANMPGAVPQTSTLALTNATLPYILELANKDFFGAIFNNTALQKGLNVFDGKIMHAAVANALNYPFAKYEDCVKVS